MTTPTAPQVDCERHHASLAVRDVRAAVDFYTKQLGFRVGFTWGDPPTIAGVNLGDVQIFLEQGTPCAEGCSVYFVVGDADELYEFHRANGVEVVEPPGDRPYGLRDYRIHDLHGYVLGFGHYIYNSGPALEIERVDVPVRLEKRLAAALRDLAEHKHMSLSSCLEETLLHTFEPLGDGVASPHTKGDLRYIQQLKRKHGIDYDSHASYRFVERGPAAEEP
jgi:catechol 2,3-dioxygenase-like lactoylglutathione lyase family enzyme